MSGDPAPSEENRGWRSDAGEDAGATLRKISPQGPALSVHVLSYVLRHSEEEGAARLVLIVLADHASSDGANSYPTMETISREARVNRRTAQRTLRQLQERGAITATGTGRNGQTVWRVEMGAASDPGAASDTEGGGLSSQKGRSDAAQTVPKPSIQQPSITSEPPSELPGMPNDGLRLFQEWLRIFGGDPRKLLYSPSRKRAAKRALAEAPLETCVKALEGAHEFRKAKPGSTEFTDIFGTFRGTGDLASRIAFFAEYAEQAQGAPSQNALLTGIPSAQRGMVRERQRHVEAMLRNPGQEAARGPGELAQQWLVETVGLRCSLDADGNPAWTRESVKP